MIADLTRDGTMRVCGGRPRAQRNRNPSQTSANNNTGSRRLRFQPETRCAAGRVRVNQSSPSGSESLRSSAVARLHTTDGCQGHACRAEPHHRIGPTQTGAFGHGESFDTLTPCTVLPDFHSPHSASPLTSHPICLPSLDVLFHSHALCCTNYNDCHSLHYRHLYSNHP